MIVFENPALSLDFRPLDRAFDVGDPTCICSRFEKPIELPVTLISLVSNGNGGERRYHPHCVGLSDL